jgi:predicted phosphodiesterase
MRQLPFDLRFELAGKPVRLVHGSPRKVNEYLFEDKPARTFERIAADRDVLVFGHTHKPGSTTTARPHRQLRLRRQTEGRRRTRRLRPP